MADPSHPLRLAVLIDGDNIAASAARKIFEKIAGVGESPVRRVYGNFSKPGMKSWSAAIASAGLDLAPRHHPSNIKGKNSTDIALVIDAMDLLHSDQFDGFVLVSSDSDFTGLACRVREHGLHVYGVGNAHTPHAFRTACNRFFPLNTVKPAPKAQKKRKPKLKPSQARGPIIDALRVGGQGESWCNLSVLGKRLLKADPDFDVRRFRKTSLRQLVRCLNGFRMRKVGRGQYEVRVAEPAPSFCFRSG